MSEENSAGHCACGTNWQDYSSSSKLDHKNSDLIHGNPPEECQDEKEGSSPHAVIGSIFMFASGRNSPSNGGNETSTSCSYCEQYGEEDRVVVVSETTTPVQSVDYKNDDLVWIPPPPENESDDEEDSLFAEEDDRESDFSSSCNFSNGFPLKLKHNEETHRATIREHFRALVSQLMQGEVVTGVGMHSLSEDWLDIITTLAWKAVEFVKPHSNAGGSMDPGGYIKVKCIASGSPRDSHLIKGVVCTKNIKHRRMVKQHQNPRLLLLGGSLEYEALPNQLASFNTLLQQEIDHLKNIVATIEDRRANVLLVEKSVSSYAQEYLLAKEISLVLNVKRRLLERVARCTGATIVPSTDQISTAQLGQCEVFRIEKVAEELESSAKKSPKTLMFFEGCRRRSGCTVLLRGMSHEQLKKVKHVLQYAAFAAYHLYLETSFLADEGASLPSFSSSPEKVNGRRHDAISTGTNCSPPPPHETEYDISRLDTEEEQLRFSELCEPDKIEKIDGDGESSVEYLSPASGHQNILVACSSRSLNGNECERSRIIRIKFYGCFDKPLGRYLCDDLFDEKLVCRTCMEPVESHERCYTHQLGSLIIKARRLRSWNLPGERERKIWMWHRCLRCAPVNGVPPAIHRVVLSDAAWGLSFGKFLELSFSNNATANRVASCGHSLQRDCLRFYGVGPMVALFYYSPIQIFSVGLPAPVVDFDSLVEMEWARVETAEVTSQMTSLYGEVSSVLFGFERRVILNGSHAIESSPHHTGMLKDLLESEREDYTVLLRNTSGRAADVLELNRLRRGLLISAHIWDHRFSLLENLIRRPSDSDGSDVLELITDDALLSSSLYARIESAWNGSVRDGDSDDPTAENPELLRVDSFDSCAARSRPRLSAAQSLDILASPVRPPVLLRSPTYISCAWRMAEGVQLLLPQPSKAGIVIGVYENEITSLISYALSTKEHGDWVSQRPEWETFGSSDVNLGAASPKKSPHLRVSYGDGPSTGDGKLRFSVTCYFARQFDGQRKKCCRGGGGVGFVRSLSRCKSWKADGGKSKVFFARSMDERFIIKQVTKTELDSFHEFAPAYFRYLSDSLSGSPTCLAKIFGIYQVSLRSGKGGRETRMDIMVMENIFSGRRISRVYDLKGSARARYNPDPDGANVTLLDTNLLELARTQPIFVGSRAKRILERAVWNDTSFLASVGVMDYSLLVGVDEERKELVVGIIDFMRQYTWDKHLETWVKASGILGGPKNVSPTIVSPDQYKRRFRKAMTGYFRTVPDQWN